MLVRRDDEQVLAAAFGKPVAPAFQQLLPVPELLVVEARQPRIMLDHPLTGPEQPAVAANGHVVAAFPKDLAPPMVVGAHQPLSKPEMIAEIGIDPCGKLLQFGHSAIRRKRRQSPLFIGQGNVIEMKEPIQRGQPQESYEQRDEQRPRGSLEFHDPFHSY